ncbi:zinc-binding dehydrogenase [Streptomyces sp. NPDC004838]
MRVAACRASVAVDRDGPEWDAGYSWELREAHLSHVGVGPTRTGSKDELDKDEAALPLIDHRPTYRLWSVNRNGEGSAPWARIAERTRPRRDETMRAAVLDPTTGAPRITDVDPSPAVGGSTVAVVAAPLNPVDLAIAAGRIPFRRLPEGAVLGIEGVAETEPGKYAYFSGPTPPWGSLAERVDLSGAETVPLPGGVAPAVAAAVGVPGIAAYLALTKAGRFTAGDRVLVLGGTGSVGRIAVHAAFALKAAAVVGTARDEDGMKFLESIGAGAVSSASADELSDGLGRLGGDGFDVVIDTLWGDFAGVALTHVRSGGRLVQVGNTAAPTASFAAADFRNRGAGVIGHSNFLVTPQERADAYSAVIELVRQGHVTAEPRVVPLADLPGEWAALASGTGRGKTVIVP